MTIQDALKATSWILSVALLIQSLEMFSLRRFLKKDSVWSWTLTRIEFETFNKPFRLLLDATLAYPNVLFLFCIQTLLCLAIPYFFHPIIFGLLFGINLLICLRWRGSFNGGSDFMTLLLLLVLTWISVAGEESKLTQGFLWYLSIQVTSSYFISGITKIRKENWREGRALIGFLESSVYGPLTEKFSLVQKPRMAKLLSWCVIIFECSFPLALISSRFTLFYLIAGFLFHLSNAYLLGLNRFFFTWISAYPALYYCSR